MGVRELFPTKLSFVIFILYMSLFIAQGIFVTASQEPNNSYRYNTVSVVLFTEILKFLVSAALYCREGNISSLYKDIKKDFKVLILYFIPAFLYCLYNNLAFINLSTFDPTTYYLLLQLRVVITGVLFQIIFKKYLNRRQWLSLLLLTCGCMIKQLNIENFINGSGEKHLMDNTTLNTNAVLRGKNMNGLDFSLSAVFIFAQTIFSCLAGVYNEYLLKDKGSDVNIFIQNIYMYLNSILCNILILCIRGEIIESFNQDNLSPIFQMRVIIIIINNAAIGIVTSFFLKYMNSILKTFASALELLFTAVLCYILFAIPIYLNTVLAISVVSYSIYLYSRNPVINLSKVRLSAHDNTHDRRKLINSISDNDSDSEMCNNIV